MYDFLLPHSLMDLAVGVAVPRISFTAACYEVIFEMVVGFAVLKSLTDTCRLDQKKIHIRVDKSRRDTIQPGGTVKDMRRNTAASLEFFSRGTEASL